MVDRTFAVAAVVACDVHSAMLAETSGLEAGVEILLPSLNRIFLLRHAAKSRKPDRNCLLLKMFHEVFDYLLSE